MSAWSLAAAVVVLAGCGERTKSEDAQASDGRAAADDLTVGRDASVPDSARDSPSTQQLAEVAVDLPADMSVPDAAGLADRPAADRAPDLTLADGHLSDLAVVADLAGEAQKDDGAGLDDAQAETSAPDDGAEPDLAADAGRPDTAGAETMADLAADVVVDASEPPDLRCRNDSDCCIVIDGCMATAYLYSKAPGATGPPPFPPNNGMCLACIPPAVQVSCVSGQCVGEKLSSSVMWEGTILQDHCGPVALPDAGTGDQAAYAGAAQISWGC